MHLSQEKVEFFLAWIEEAARNARISLVAAQADYDKAERFRPTGRVDAVRTLVGVSARVRAEFDLPLAAMPEGAWLEFWHPAMMRGQGVWLVRDEVGREDPLDVMEAWLGGNDELLDHIVLEELACRDFLDDPVWPHLKRTYQTRYGIRCRADRLTCRLQIDLDAYVPAQGATPFKGICSRETNQ